MASSRPSDPSNSRPNAPQTRDNRISAGHRPDDERFRRLAELIAAAPHNLVARGERAEIYDRHVLEGVALAGLLAPTGRWMDLGTGGGLPGLVLALCHPDVEWTLVDATAKKVEAVRGFARALELTNVYAVHGRAETLAHDPRFRGTYDGLVARAVAPLPTLVELSRGFLGDTGALVAVKGPGWAAELAAAEPALRRLAVQVESTVRLESEARASWVVTMRAQGPPPDGFPRRDGVPKADPLR